MNKTCFVLVPGLLLLAACSIFAAQPINQKANADPYEITTAQVKPDIESRIELSDGAGISIPAGALSAETTVKVERNPEKSQKLPPLDEGLLPISNFYNFEITGGDLNDRLDLILPFDKSLIPQDQKNGFLVAAVPDKSGWKYVPVEPTGNKVILWTDQIGDPIIAWHFIPKEDYPPMCSPYIDIQVDPQSGTPDTEFTIIGRVKPFKVTSLVPSFLTENENLEQAVSKIPVSISLSPENYTDPKSENFSAVTDDSGSFSFKLPRNLNIGWWWIRAQATCKTPENIHGWRNMLPSEGRVNLRVVSDVEKTEIVPVKETEIVPTREANPKEATASIPPGANQIPDVVGISLDEAVKKLEDLGFGVTWIDGKSPMELGQIYQQKPAAGEYFVPHRTTVLIYRTIEVITGPFGCYQFNLTQQECANSGIHKYTQSWSTNNSEKCPNGIHTLIDLSIIFSKNSVVVNLSENGWKIDNNLFTKKNLNEYSGTKKNTVDGRDFTFHFIFNNNGFTLIEDIEDCHWEGTFMIQK